MYIYTIIYLEDTKIAGFFLWQYSTKDVNTVIDSRFVFKSIHQPQVTVYLTF